MKITDGQYLDAIMETYLIEYGGEELATLLMHPSIGKIKEACLFLLQQKLYSRVDIINLNHFLNFGKTDTYKKYKEEELENAIKDYTGFKRVVQFIARYKDNKENSTDLANVEFIAWLTNFRPRPFNAYRSTLTTDNAVKELSGQQTDSYTSKKELHIFEQILFNDKLLRKFREEVLKMVLKEYDLENNDSFIRYRKKMADDIVMQAFTIKELKRKLNILNRQLKHATFARRYLGLVGLFFVNVDYREASVTTIFEDFTDIYQGLEDDFWDDFI